MRECCDPSRQRSGDVINEYKHSPFAVAHNRSNSIHLSFFTLPGEAAHQHPPQADHQPGHVRHHSGGICHAPHHQYSAQPTLSTRWILTAKQAVDVSLHVHDHQGPELNRTEHVTVQPAADGCRSLRGHYASTQISPTYE